MSRVFKLLGMLALLSLPLRAQQGNQSIPPSSSGSGITPAQLPGGNVIYVATSCPASTPTCFQVNDNVLVSQNVTYSNGSGNFTTLASDPAFVAQSGLIAFAAGRCTGDVSRCFTDCPQGTLTVNSAHSATNSVTCTNTSSGAANANNLAWGLDDGPQLAAAFAALFPLSFGSNALIPQPTKALFLPCGMMFTSVNPFITNGTLSTQGGGIKGCGGGGGTVIIPLPKMNGTSTGGALFADNGGNLDNNGRNLAGWHLRDFSFWGLGGNVKDASATFTAGEPGIFLNITDEMDNVWVIGWLWADASTPVGVLNLDGLMINSGSFAGGFFPCELEGLLGVEATMIGGSCGGSSGASILTPAGPAVMEGVYVNQAFGSGNNGFGVNNNGGKLIDHGSHFTDGIVSSAAGSISYLSGTIIDQFGGGNSALTVQNGIVHLLGTNFVASGTPITQTGGTIYDDCGNGILPAPAFPPIITNLYGSCSATGVALVATNVTASTGWGTSGAAGNGISAPAGDNHIFTFTVTAAGTPTANPTLAVTFPTPFWAPPSGGRGCSATQILGTGAIADLTTTTLPTNTTVTFTWNATPVAGSTYVIQGRCG